MPQLPPELFRRVCGAFPTGVAIAAFLDAARQPQGLTVNSFASVSLDPPLISICIDRGAALHDAFVAANSFSINILREEDEVLSNRFAFAAGPRFSGLAWHVEEPGAPVLENLLAWLTCRRHHSIAAGDHTILLGEVENAAVAGGAPLLYFNSRYARLREP